jgi:hypothetical protein
MFGLILDMPPEAIDAGRHIFANPTREGLLFDISAWFGKSPGPDTRKHIAAFRRMIEPLERGHTVSTYMARDRGALN